MPNHLLSAVVAHQGGWDEILLVVGPIATIVTLLVVVKRRLDRAMASRSDSNGPLKKGSKTD